MAASIEAGRAEGAPSPKRVAVRAGRPAEPATDNVSQQKDPNVRHPDE